MSALDSLCYKSIIYALVLVTLASCNMIDRFTFFPDKSSSIPGEELPVYVSELYIDTIDGETIQSFLFHHKGEKRPLIIYFHGNAGNLYYRFDTADKLYQLDHDVLLVSYRGYARSSGKPTEQGIYTDGSSAVNYAIEKLRYQENEIVVFGRSLGSTVAVHIAQHKNFNKVVLITPLTSGKDMAVAMGLGLFKFVAGNSYNSLEKINNIKSPILIIHGDKDQVVPYHMGKKLYHTFDGRKHMVTIENGRHNDLQEVNPELYWGEIKRFIQ